MCLGVSAYEKVLSLAVVWDPEEIFGGIRGLLFKDLIITSIHLICLICILISSMETFALVCQKPKDVSYLGEDMARIPALVKFYYASPHHTLFF